MDQFDTYCALLGVGPGASAEEVKKAFRHRIKQYHPDTAAAGAEVNDTALQLIEAYQALKNGAPPPRFKDTDQGREYFRRQREEALRNRAQMYRERRAAEIQRMARAAGRRLYDEMFSDPRKSQADELSFWEQLSEMVFGVEPGARYYGENIEVHEIRPGVRAGARTRERPRTAPRSRPARTHESTDGHYGSLDQGRRFFERAEHALRQVVRRYDVPAALRRRSWLREYMAGLNNCQVLFRDVAVRHPAHSGAAMNRVRQIQELAQELRQMG